MKQNYNELPNGYLESINRGILAVQSFRGGMSRGKLSRAEAIARLKTEIETAIIDMVETAENVWSDSCVAAIVDKRTQVQGA